MKLKFFSVISAMAFLSSVSHASSWCQVITPDGVFHAMNVISDQPEAQNEELLINQVRISYFQGKNKWFLSAEEEDGRFIAQSYIHIPDLKGDAFQALTIPLGIRNSMLEIVCDRP